MLSQSESSYLDAGSTSVLTDVRVNTKELNFEMQIENSFEHG